MYLSDSGSLQTAWDQWNNFAALQCLHWSILEWTVFTWGSQFFVAQGFMFCFLKKPQSRKKTQAKSYKLEYFIEILRDVGVPNI